MSSQKHDDNVSVADIVDIVSANISVTANVSLAEAITPYVPLVHMVKSLVKEIALIHENSSSNKQTCAALLDRVEIAQEAVKSFERKYQANENFFRNLDYQNASIRFVNVLENIKKFVTEIAHSQKSNPKTVKDAYEKYNKEYNEAFSLEILKKSMIDTKDEIMVEIRLAIREVTMLVSSQKNDKAFHLQEEYSEKFELLSSQKHNYNDSYLQGELNEGFGEPTHVAGQTQDVIAPFVPLFSIVMNIHDQMLSIYENATCNEKICSALLDRVEFVHTVVKSKKFELKYHINKEKFRKQDYYYAWIKFVNVLEKIKEFAKEAAQITSFRKFMSAKAVKDACEKIIKEFEGFLVL
ncbi:1042_t:CDS:2 [Dentiscutata erythropus]|uniref:1042_t:CDS:1 n=1 Tax=Dentiscutata erythropus TaxID=1348616 RepID=A0A9N9K2A7_9GLOM|nr:1042_t:CDS:2 [Dentiscutata erythropus]